jgi:hypothetical protein
MVYIDGTAIVNPYSWVGKGLIMDIATETTCEGNSMCVYSHATMTEAPYYMNETADAYFIRNWRPVGVVQQFGLWQTALQHVPSNPRFYLVSPCFGVAKIWKTDSDMTIYVAMDKCQITDNSTDKNADTSASNYCYADTNLINQYVAIWGTSDFGTIIEAVLTGGTSEVLKVTTKALIKAGDPINVVQGLAEAAVSWPGAPWSDMTYEKMTASSTTCIGKGFKENLDSVQNPDV